MAEMFEMCLHTGKFWAAAKKCDDVWSAWRGSAGSTSGRGFGAVVVPRVGWWFLDPLRNFIGKRKDPSTVPGWGGFIFYFQFKICKFSPSLPTPSKSLDFEAE